MDAMPRCRRFDLPQHGFMKSRNVARRVGPAAFARQPSRDRSCGFVSVGVSETDESLPARSAQGSSVVESQCSVPSASGARSEWCRRKPPRFLTELSGTIHTQETSRPWGLSDEFAHFVVCVGQHDLLPVWLAAHQRLGQFHGLRGLDLRAALAE